jgi:hypothetical protein
MLVIELYTHYRWTRTRSLNPFNRDVNGKLLLFNKAYRGSIVTYNMYNHSSIEDPNKPPIFSMFTTRVLSFIIPKTISIEFIWLSPKQYITELLKDNIR